MSLNILSYRLYQAMTSRFRGSLGSWRARELIQSALACPRQGPEGQTCHRPLSCPIWIWLGSHWNHTCDVWSRGAAECGQPCLGSITGFARNLSPNIISGAAILIRCARSSSQRGYDAGMDDPGGIIFTSTHLAVYGFRL